MNGFDAYRMYVATKNHFVDPSYDIFKYYGKLKLSVNAFELRNDKYFFYQLAKHRHPFDYLVANAIEGNIIWPGDLFGPDGEKNYLKWLKRKDSLSYLFKLNLNELSSDFNSDFICKDGQYPPLLVKYKQGKITLETLIILDDILNFIPHWNKNITDTIIWPSIYLLITKYRPFLKYNLEEYKKMLKDHVL